MNSPVDIVLINPGDRKLTYQGLGIDLAAVEPPFWVAVLGSHLLSQGYRVEIIDSNAENISPDETADKVADIDPLLTAVIVYGSNPSASTPNMAVAGKICRAIRERSPSKVCLGGLHPSALPRRTMEEENVDFVIEGEGPVTLQLLIEVLRDGRAHYANVPGLWYREHGTILHNDRAPLIKDLDQGLPLAAWHLLPMEKYKAHNWHCFDDIDNRMPYGAVYTSLGCPYSCVFCCINAPFGKPGIRFRSPRLVVDELEILAKDYGVKNVKIVDELFVFNKKHYMAISNLIIQRGLDFNIWAYARVDTIDDKNLERMKKAGVNWLALGIETGSERVLDGANKRTSLLQIKEAVKKIQSFDIRIVGNYIFGLPDDTVETINETLALAQEVNAEWANFYCAMAYPGSRLYDMALEEKWELPSSWNGFSQLSFDTHPLPTKHISARQVLQFRDAAFVSYFENETYLHMIKNKFGQRIVDHIREMSRIKIDRTLLNGVVR